MGGFHIVMNYLAVLGKKFQSSGIEDLLIESGMYESSTTSILLKENSYNRGIRAHKIAMEAMFRLQWRAMAMPFVQWLSQQGDSRVGESLVIEQVIACLQTLEEGKYVSTAMHTMCDAIIPLQSEFMAFETEARRKSQLFAFWSDCVCMVLLLLQFRKAERTGNWLLHWSVTATMTPHFFSMDGRNYPRWVLVLHS